ncbi:MAG: hypothetical protein PVG55_02925 [Nitrospirota bacterium]|jgi:hypothetical protein
MMRFVTQILVGLMLLFGTATLIPKAAVCFRLGRKGRGVLYVVLGVLSTAFALMAFGYAYTVATDLF